ncbi:hypothetical protein PBY51_000136 [Eleginops maclovinus]|uniref:Uncharacterized protein n=1 Tax=Eleginops maclovinus TaxID=56733 RepID=A0AAN7XLN6_ELEMC|nr:hypothetical protein PBY51_000136 [Eleginops maclovinus]
MERPAGAEGNVPVYNAPDEEEVGEVRNAVEDEGEAAVVVAGCGHGLIEEEEEEEEGEETEEEEEDDEEVQEEQEEDEEEDQEEDEDTEDEGDADIGRLSPLVQQLPQVNSLQAFLRNFPPGLPGPHGDGPLEASLLQEEHPEEHSSNEAPSTSGVCRPMVPTLHQLPLPDVWRAILPEKAQPSPPPRSEESAPSGLGFSTKRTREEDSNDEAPSNFGQGFSKRTKEQDSRDSAPSTSGLCRPIVATFGRHPHRVNFCQLLGSSFGVAPLEASALQVEHPEEGPPSPPPRSEESAPSGLGFSTKRTREEDSNDEAPSNFGQGFSKRTKEQDSRDSAPSTSGLCRPIVATFGRHPHLVNFCQLLGSSFGVAPLEASALQVEHPEEAPPSPTPRSEESAPSGLGFSTKRTREEDSRDEAPSIFGLGFSTKRTREEDSSDEAPSTSGLGPPMDKKSRLEDHRIVEDSDSD